MEYRILEPVESGDRMSAEAYQSHVAAMIADTGQWVGLLDENWQPLCDAPPLVEFKAGGQRLDTAECEAVFHAGGKRLHPLISELVAEDLGVFSERGNLIPANTKARSLCIQRGDYSTRQAYFITHATCSGGVERPELIRVHGQDLLGLLAATPCPSVPIAWDTTPLRSWREDAGGEYQRELTYGQVKMADALDGYTMAGEAISTLETLIQDSVDALCRKLGWSSPHIVVDVDQSERPDDQILIKVQDQSVWEALVEPARVSGVTLSCFLWWPGDPPIMARPARGQAARPTRFSHPICVVRCRRGAQV